MAAATREGHYLILRTSTTIQRPSSERATLAWAQAQMRKLHHLGISFDDAHLFQRLANHVLYSDPVLRPGQKMLKGGMRKASTLWANGISGDLPIILAEVTGEDDLELVRQLQHAHEYWRLKRLFVDLVVLNDSAPSYVQDFQNSLGAMARTNRSIPQTAGDVARGSIFVLQGDLVSSEVRDPSARRRARRSFGRSGQPGRPDQSRARSLTAATAPPVWPATTMVPSEPALSLPTLEFFNGIGGFAADGREYVTILKGADRTPGALDQYNR